MSLEKVIRRQVNLKSLCKSCGHHSERTPFEAGKFWEFFIPRRKTAPEIFGQNAYLPVKPRREREIAEAVKKHAAKGVSARKDILCSVLREGKELSEVESKADQMLDRVILRKISTTSKGNTDFSKLIERRIDTRKRDAKKYYSFLIYKLNHRDLNNQPTYVFKLVTFQLISQRN